MIFLQGVEFHIAMNIALITFEGVGSSHFNSSCSTQFRRWSPRLQFSWLNTITGSTLLRIAPGYVDCSLLLTVLNNSGTVLLTQERIASFLLVKHSIPSSAINSAMRSPLLWQTKSMAESIIFIVTLMPSLSFDRKQCRDDSKKSTMHGLVFRTGTPQYFENDIQISSCFFGFDLVFDVYDVKIHHHTIY